MKLCRGGKQHASSFVTFRSLGFEEIFRGINKVKQVLQCRWKPTVVMARKSGEGYVATWLSLSSLLFFPGKYESPRGNRKITPNLGSGILRGFEKYTSKNEASKISGFFGPTLVMFLST